MYKTTVNNTHNISVHQTDIEALDSIEVATNTLHVLDNNQSIKAKITAGNFNNKTYTVTLHNTDYKVVIKDTLDQLIDTLGFQVGQAKMVNSVKAPMPGLILDVMVQQGQNVTENEPLLILEAMKMENVINAPRDGVIKNIAVTQSEAVDKNTVLIEFE